MWFRLFSLEQAFCNFVYFVSRNRTLVVYGSLLVKQCPSCVSCVRQLAACLRHQPVDFQVSELSLQFVEISEYFTH